jgi:oxygen-independent coproporphyrinogen-3 oxidase
MGPAAVSTLQGRRWTNPCALDEYAATVDAGTIGHDAETLTLMERVQELVMLRLRTTRGLRVKAYRELTGRDFIRDNKSLIHALHRNQLVRIRNGYLSLTRNGLLVSNAILERFFSEMETVLGDSRPVPAKEPEVLGNGSGPGSASGQGDGQGSDRGRGQGNDRGSGQENRLSGPEQKEGSTAAPEHGQGGGSH